MFKPEIFPASVRTVGLCVSMLALLSCARDDLAPDCFEPDPEGSGCLIPFPGATDVTASCDDDDIPPIGAVGAEYEFDLHLVTTGGTGQYTNWIATTPLPPGVTLNAESGVLNTVDDDGGAMPFDGIGGPGNTAYPLSYTVQDAQTGETYDFDCGEIEVRERLNSNGIRNELRHCLPHTSSMADMVAALQGGDGTEITCEPLAISDPNGSCPMGDGNGRPPPGITFDADTCTHTGSINSDAVGTWVWAVEISQSGATTYVPFCATNDISTFHDITYTANAVVEGPLQPGYLEYDPNQGISFSGMNYNWLVEDPACTGNPTDCNSYGYTFSITCSPFDPPFGANETKGDNGFDFYFTSLEGPTPEARYANRPFVTSIQFEFCTSANGSFCATADPGFAGNAQTTYHFDVVGYPVINNP